MLDQAEEAGTLKKGQTIVEFTSGNTGIGMAMWAAAKGYNISLFMPDSVSAERMKLFCYFGAKCHLMPRELGGARAIDSIGPKFRKDPMFFYTSQFDNKANPQIHYDTTAVEIIEAFDDLPVDYLVCGIGTGGHISGCGKRLKEKWPNLKNYAVEPEESHIFEKGGDGSWDLHKLMGMAPDFIPGNYWPEYVDDVLKINGNVSWDYARRAGKEEGLLCGITSGGCLAGVAQLFEQGIVDPRDNRTILTFAYDSAERYLSFTPFLPPPVVKLSGLEYLTAEEMQIFKKRISETSPQWLDWTETKIV
eukprot:TRINITY_DN15939_c0_g1_i1.p1 TRINITY_DN15939_c0_g1~~TRINITY_DN15939_c0_g1_i1.p1  ORF type:complete len:305 (-),score=56.03 TRINITY_DN15939_c0_g1_i1:137-1051(-)